MQNVVIRSERLGKKYSINHSATNLPYVTFRDVLVQTVRSGWNKTRNLFSNKAVEAMNSQEELWALKDVNFEIQVGEVVGVVGRNGAGKSTLLKILSRITEPSAGKVSILGRVASLLEVGTGFHPELTGSENIFLNGSILGMSRGEIKKKFDAIVDFAGVEKFLDTPVKRYSSGMYVRLAFAVASHLEPDILIVDEVLAVGDMEFQKKCLGRMNDFSKSGRTVIFVSHNLPMVSSLCNKCLLLENGQVVEYNDTAKVLAKYHSSVFEKKSLIKSELGINKDQDCVIFIRAWVGDMSAAPQAEFSIFDPVRLYLSYEVLNDLSTSVLPFFHILDSKGEYVLLTSPYDWGFGCSSKKGCYTAVCEIPAHFLNNGAYSVTVQVNTVDTGHNLEFFEHHAISFVIIDNIYENPYRIHTKFSYEIPGVVRPLLKWQLT